MNQISSNDRFHTIDILLEWYIPILIKRLGLNDDIENYTEQAENLILALEEYRFRHLKDFNIFSQKVKRLDAMNQKLKLDPNTLANPPHDISVTLVMFFKFVLLLPFVWYFRLNNIPIDLVNYFILRNKDIDPENDGKSIMIGTLLILLFMYGLQTFLVGYFFGNWWMSLFYIISIFVSGYLKSFNERYAEIAYQQKTYTQVFKDPNHEFPVLYREIIYMMDNIFKDWINKNID